MNNLIVIPGGSTELPVHKNLEYNYAYNMSKNLPTTATLHKTTSH
jgi:hypothetical protein